MVEYVLETNLPVEECRRRLAAATTVSGGLSWDDAPLGAVQCRMQLGQANEFELRLKPGINVFWRVLSGQFHPTRSGTRVYLSTRLPAFGRARAIFWASAGTLGAALAAFEGGPGSRARVIGLIAMAVAAILGVVAVRLSGSDEDLIDFLRETLDARVS